jgi:hypothetical protein
MRAGLAGLFMVILRLSGYEPRKEYLAGHWFCCRCQSEASRLLLVGDITRHFLLCRDKTLGTTVCILDMYYMQPMYYTRAGEPIARVLKMARDIHCCISFFLFFYPTSVSLL